MSFFWIRKKKEKSPEDSSDDIQVSQDKLKNLYDTWIDNIVSDCKDTKELLRHISHHAEEGIQEGLSETWFASIENLIDIIKRKHRQKEVSLLVRVERLYQHWLDDPKNMTPPPQLDSFKKMIDIETSRQAQEPRHYNDDVS